MEDVKISQLAELKEVEVVVQQVVVNDQVQNIMGKSWVIACPKCGRVIYRFPQGISKLDAIKAKSQGINELLMIATYCPTCGTKLCYGGEDIEGNFEIIKESEESLS